MTVATAGRAFGLGALSTRALLTAGVVAGPFYIALVVGQALTRDGFDIGRHPASMLSNGTWAGSRSPTSRSAACCSWRTPPG